MGSPDRFHRDPHVTPRHFGRERPHRLFQRLEYSPQVGDALLALGRALNDEVDGRVLELVALRVSAVRECTYVWRGHCRIVLQRDDAGLSLEDIARIATGPDAMDRADAVVVRAVDELLADGRLTGPTQDDLAALGLGVDVPVVTGFYATVASLMDGAEPDAEPVAGLQTPAVAAAAISGQADPAEPRGAASPGAVRPPPYGGAPARDR